MTDEWPVKTDISHELFREATCLLPKGVHSTAQCADFFRPYPIFMERGKGSRIMDVDKNEYIDYILANGPLILGHAPPKVITAIREQLEKGTLFGAPNELMIKVARKVVDLVPAIDKIEFTNSGVESTMHAIRLARAYTRKDKIIKFDGHYHGAHDYVLLNLGWQSASTHMESNKVPFTGGIPDSTLQSVLALPWNDLEALEGTIKQHGQEIAAVIMEPIMANCGVILPEEGYLKAVRELTDQNNIVLIFDEIITGFRVALGGAQELYGVTPDLVTLAKALGGGVPIGAYGGKREIMDIIEQGKVIHYGTYNANPLVLAASLATIVELEKGGLERSKDISQSLMNGIRDMIQETNISAIVQGVPSLFQVFFTNLEKITNPTDLAKVDLEKFDKFERALLKNGVLVHPKQTSRWHTSAAHTNKDVDKTLQAVRYAFKIL